MPETIVFVGDVHGNHDRMVEEVRTWERAAERSTDLIVSVGDFQALRDEHDMRCMTCPTKHMHLGDFPAYHRGERRFPATVLFIGGNHEAYNWLDQMPAGGPVGPDCQYIGRVGVVERFGLRIGGLTGIYSAEAFVSGRQSVDYDNPRVIENRRRKKRSTYYERREVETLAASGPIDVLVTHEWPEGLARLATPGTTDGRPGAGIGVLRALLQTLKPRWLFCGHMHWSFSGEIHWPDGKSTTFACLGHILNEDSSRVVALCRDDNDWRIEASHI